MHERIMLGPTEKHYLLVAKTIAFFKPEDKIKILEIGAGPKMIKKFLPENVQYDTMDNAENFWREKYTYTNNLDDGKFPIKNGTYDIVICLETLEHVMYPEKVISEIIRIAKENAVFLFSMPNEYNFLSRLYFLIGKKTAVEEPFKVVEKNLHIHRPRVSDILDLFSRYFVIKNVEYIWQSRISETSRIARTLDRALSFLARIKPSLFARTVSLKCLKKNK